MKSILLTLLLFLPSHSDNVVLYFGLHQSPASEVLASMLNTSNNGIALHIPTTYIKNALYAMIAMSIVLLLYKYKSTHQNKDVIVLPCTCDFCQEMKS